MSLSAHSPCEVEYSVSQESKTELDALLGYPSTSSKLRLFQQPVNEQPPLETADIPYNDEDQEIIHKLLEVLNDDNFGWTETKYGSKNTRVFFCRDNGLAYSKGVKRNYLGHVDDLLHVHFITPDEYMEGLDSSVLEMKTFDGVHPYVRTNYLVYDFPSPAWYRDVYVRTIVVRVLADGTITQPSEKETWLADPDRKMLQIQYSIEPPGPFKGEKNYVRMKMMTCLGIESRETDESGKRMFFCSCTNVGGFIPQFIVNELASEFGEMVDDFENWIDFSKSVRGSNPKKKISNFKTRWAIHEEQDEWSD